MHSRVVVLVVLVALLACSVVAQQRVHLGLHVPQKLNVQPPKHYSLLGKAAPEHMIRFSIALKQQNTEELERMLTKVSNPKSAEYGNYLTLEQVTKMVKPTSATRNTVTSWLQEHEITNFAEIATGDFLRVSAPVKHVEKLFATELYHFQHTQSARKLLRANTALSVRADIAQHIDFVGGLTRFPQFKAQSSLNPYLRDQAADSSMQLTAADVLAGAAANNPVLLSGVEGNEQLSVLIRVVCKDNTFSTTPLAPCSDHAPAVASFNFKLSMPTYAMPQSVVIPVSAASCFLSAPDNNIVNCRVTLENLKNYAAITVGLTTQYDDGTTSTASAVATPAFLSQFTTPQDLHNYYGINFLHGTNPANRQSVAEFLGQYYAESDLQKFFSDTGLAPQKVSRVVGPNNEAQPGGEATLDIEYIMAIGLNVTTDFWSVAGGDDQHEPFLDWLLQLSNTTDNIVPLVHSISYGDVERGYDVATLTRLSTEFQKAGLRGLSLIVSSGDDGTGNEPARTDPSYCTPFTPSFPASSPWITTVGATQFSTFATAQCAQTDQRAFGGVRYSCNDVKEIACSSDTGGVITTGGGFSNVFPRPDYQTSFVSQYLKTAKLPASSLYNNTGRAYPDVSTMGHNFLVVLEGKTIPIHGTSASAPLFAGMVSLLNDIRLNNGGKPLGFLNPYLYQLASDNYGAFYDVTVGSNNCTASYWPAKPFCCDGFSAAAGYDPLTGLGSPRFDIIKANIEKEFVPSSPTIVFIIITAVLGLAVVILAVFSGVLYVRVRHILSGEMQPLIQ